MFDLRKMLNTLFGVIDNNDCNYVFDVDTFIKSIFGEIKLDDKPKYELSGIHKSISLVGANGTIKLRVGIYGDHEKSKLLQICCVNTTNNYEFDINVRVDKGKMEFYAEGSKDFFVLKDNKVSYYSDESIFAYSILSGHKPVYDECDFGKYAIKPDESIVINSINDFETIVGSFINKNLFNSNKKPNISLDDLADSISCDFFDKNMSDEFRLSKYFKELYKGLVIPLSDAEPGYVVESSDEANIKRLRVKGDGVSNLDFISITSTNSILGDNKSIDIVTTNMESKIYTTLSMDDGKFSFFSKLLSNVENEETMDPAVCEIIVGDLNGAKYYNKDSVDAYAKLKDIAFKMELDGQQSFADYFVYPDKEVVFDQSARIDTQLGEFFNGTFFPKVEKVDNKLVLKR